MNKIGSISEYNEEYQKSIEHPEQFWQDKASTFKWSSKWNKVLDKIDGVVIRTYEYDNSIEDYSESEINKFDKIYDQYDFRKSVILDTLNSQGINLTKLSAVVGRGGLLKPIEGGTYEVTENMIKDLKQTVLL